MFWNYYSQNMFTSKKQQVYSLWVAIRTPNVQKAKSSNQPKQTNTTSRGKVRRLGQDQLNRLVRENWHTCGRHGGSRTALKARWCKSVTKTQATAKPNRTFESKMGNRPGVKHHKTGKRNKSHIAKKNNNKIIKHNNKNSCNVKTF